MRWGLGQEGLNEHGLRFQGGIWFRLVATRLKLPKPRCRPREPQKEKPPRMAESQRTGTGKALHTALAEDVRDRYRFLPAWVLHNEAQPKSQREDSPATWDRQNSPPPGLVAGPRPASNLLRDAGDAGNLLRNGRSHASTGRRSARRVHCNQVHPGVSQV